MIDKNGKLFGLINIIDLLIIIVIGAIIIIGSKRLSGPQAEVSQTTKGQVVYEIGGVRDVTVDNINEGDELYHYDKNVLIGTIVDKEVKEYKEPLRYEDQWLMEPVPERYSVYITVDCDVEEDNNKYVIGGEETRVGGQYRLKNKNFTSFGTCFGVQVEEQ